MREPRISYEGARLRLARYQVESAEARTSAACFATRISADSLGVERVGVWFLRDGMLEPVRVYVRSRGELVAGEPLDLTRYPRYLQLLHERCATVADDARASELTRELVEDYLIPHGITSILDAPIIVGPQVVGVVCHEHVGPPREWKQREIDFAGSVADLFATMLVQAERAEREAMLLLQASEAQVSAKMGALIRVAHALCHDFNNLLTTVALNTRTLQAHADAEVREIAADIDSATELSSALVCQLAEFAREAVEEPPVVDAAEQVLQGWPALTAAAGPAISLRRRVAGEALPVRIDPLDLTRALLNLLANAREAGAHEVTVAVRPSTTTDVFGDGAVLVEVSDDGPGMEESMVEHLFEPFFTTKSGGHGLGLASTYAAVRRAGGDVVVRSAPSQGTTIALVLPRARAPEAPEAPDAPSS